MCPTVRGHDCVSLPDGFTAPDRMRAIAAPPSSPGRHVDTTAPMWASASLEGPNVCGRPCTSTSTTGLPLAAAATARRSGSWPPPNSRESRSPHSPHSPSPSPRTSTVTSTEAASAVACARPSGEHEVSGSPDDAQPRSVWTMAPRPARASGT
eukprot:1032723-Prymnesium_polylepis.1